jgi:hypothetical protein
MSWDLQALLALVILAGLGLLSVPIAHWIKRAVAWRRVHHLRYAYLPHSTSGTPWRDNKRVR